MLIRVVRFRGMAPDVATEAVFTQAGGTIGRSAQCTLPLPDPERHISRIQAEISCDGSQFLLVDRGTANPVQQNGVSVGFGKSATLNDGDELHIGDYVLRVEISQQSANAARPLSDPFADLITPSAHENDSGANHPLAPKASDFDNIIPDDFDPFGPKSRCILPSQESKGWHDDALLGSGTPTPEPSLDAMFGLGGAPADPLAIGSPLGGPIMEPNTASSIDPLSAFDQPSVVPAGPTEDRSPEIHGQFKLPTVQPIPNTSFMSWNGPDGASHTHIVGKAKTNRPPATGNTGREQETDDATNSEATSIEWHAQESSKEWKAGAEPCGPRQIRGEMPAQDSPQGKSTTSANDENIDTLLKAFLEGADLPALPAALQKGNQELDEKLMFQIGALLRLFAQGTINLLAARATIKSEMRAEMTIIGAQTNNPLKFSPDAVTALNHLLVSRPTRGFMDAQSAVNDAMNDLNAHQLGVMAGMQAALMSILQRFEPVALEKRLTKRTVLDTMLLKSRKAQLWELFEQTYNAIANEAEDDFEALFSREFVKAYEAQMHYLEKKH